MRIVSADSAKRLFGIDRAPWGRAPRLGRGRGVLGVLANRFAASGFERLGIKVRFGLVMVFGCFGGRVVSLIIWYLYI